MVASANKAMPGRPAVGIGHYLRDLVYGASDGVITTTAVIAAATGAMFDSRVVVVLGLANLAADGLSMGASNYLGLKSELEQVGASVAEEAPWRHGLATTVAFVLAGAIPLAPYLWPGTPGVARFVTALVLAGATLAGVGAARSLFLARSALRCGVEMLVIAGAASGVAYLIGRIVEASLR